VEEPRRDAGRVAAEGAPVARAVVDEHLGGEDHNARDEHGGHEPRPPPPLLVRGDGAIRGGVLRVPRALPLAGVLRHGVECPRSLPPLSPQLLRGSGYSSVGRSSGLVGAVRVALSVALYSLAWKRGRGMRVGDVTGNGGVESEVGESGSSFWWFGLRRGGVRKWLFEH
jgi:hypothetical protein